MTVLLQHMTGDCSTVWTPALMLLLSGNRQSMWYLSELTDRPCVTDPLGIVSTYTDLEKSFSSISLSMNIHSLQKIKYLMKARRPQRSGRSI